MTKMVPKRDRQKSAALFKMFVWLFQSLNFCPVLSFNYNLAIPNTATGQCCNQTKDTCKNKAVCGVNTECDCSLLDPDFSLSGMYKFLRSDNNLLRTSANAANNCTVPSQIPLGIPWGMRLFASSIAASPSGRSFFNDSIGAYSQ